MLIYVLELSKMLSLLPLASQPYVLSFERYSSLPKVLPVTIPPEVGLDSRFQSIHSTIGPIVLLRCRSFLLKTIFDRKAVMGRAIPVNYFHQWKCNQEIKLFDTLRAYWSAGHEDMKSLHIMEKTLCTIFRYHIQIMAQIKCLVMVISHSLTSH